MGIQTSSEAIRRALRLIDANANRAAEGLRTIEDYARLVKEDALAAGWVKELRHRLATAMEKFDRPQRLAARSTETDAGTGITHIAEAKRESLDGVVRAASERVTQALRCLEEYAKYASDSAGADFKQLRYVAYDLLAKTELRLLSQNPATQAQLYLLVDCQKSIEPFIQYLRELAAAGVDLFQLRDKRAEGATLVRYARAAVEALRSTEAKLIFNDRVDIALASGAAGVHLGQEDLSLADARRLAGTALCVGVSTHNLEQVIAAEQAGADYIGCGPTFPSETKSFEHFPGPQFLQSAITHGEAVSERPLPIFAIGGIDRSNVQACVAAGCRRIAVSRAIHATADPLAAARALKQVLQEAAIGRSVPASTHP